MKNNINLINNKIKSCITVLNVLQSLYWSHLDTEQNTNRVIGRFLKMSRTRGLLSAVEDMKSARLTITKFVASEPLSGKVGTPIDKQGLPKVLTPALKKLVQEKDIMAIKYLLTLFSISRYATGLKPVDTKPIEDTYSGFDTPTDSEILLALNKLKIPRAQLPPIKFKFDWITTAGPSGPSISSALTDLPVFRSEFKDQVAILNPFLLPRLEKLTEWMTKLNISKLLGLEYKFKSLRRLSLKSDAEGKTRIFAMMDYWTQTTLTPLHDWAFDTLRGISQDCTFDQHSGVEKMAKCPNIGKFYSIDLKSATDRFPVNFQEKVLSLIFSKEYASAWNTILTSLPFDPGSTGIKRPIKWAVGQPLGARSSWGIFSLCHHLVVTIAAQRTNSKLDYVILGDDIVIKGDALAGEYLNIIKGLGVETSFMKTHASIDTFEFAKVWSHRGINVSPFPISGLLDLWLRPIELASLLVEELPRKGYDLQLCPRTIASVVSRFHKCYPYHRLGVFHLNLTVEAVAVIMWMKTHRSDWASFLTQMAKIELRRDSANNLFLYSVNWAWRHLINTRIDSLRSFSWKVASGLPDELAFLDMDDDDLMISGSTDGYSLQLPEHLTTNLPIFGALEREFQRSGLLMEVLSNPIDLLSGAQMKALTLPPVAQLKGFKPERTKSGVLAISMLTRSLRELMRTLSTVSSSRKLPRQQCDRSSARSTLEG